MIKILYQDIYWKGKLLVFTWHFKAEYEHINKPIEFIIEILEHGKHVLVAKKQNKYNVFHPIKNKWLCISYAIHDNIVLIHIKKQNEKIHENML